MARPKRSIVAAAQEASTPPAALEPSQSLVRVVKAEGNNLYLCQLPDQAELLVELAQRFRNTVWIKRGGYVVVQRYPENDQNGRVVGEIVNVVGDEKAWRKQPYWPKEFVKNSGLDDEEDEDSTVGKMPPSDSEDER
ncbi:hypothetical protein B0T11DRAFT_327360 [Plectosphaerella cucumerina]|uniref:S1-like domain-containing protein n=1 Tax=Plectosphaerella cucumerina TaxID=40658 RepID=A0A8K0TQ02_9PEZI|nr:hypothetical protein B0T11DRAFT_327360 [Plectosphaerella cucumerina]